MGNFRISWVCIAGVKWLNDASGTHVRAMSNPKFPLPGPKNAAPYDSRVGQSITSFHCVADAGSDIGIRALACASVLTGCVFASAPLSPRPPTVPFDLPLPLPREPREDDEEDDAAAEEEEDEAEAAARRRVASVSRSDADAALSLETRPRDLELDIFQRGETRTREREQDGEGRWSVRYGWVCCVTPQVTQQNWKCNFWNFGNWFRIPKSQHRAGHNTAVGILCRCATQS